MQSTSSVKQTLAAPENTELVIALLQADPTPNRNGLAKELCRRLELRDSKGDWADSHHQQGPAGVGVSGLVATAQAMLPAWARMASDAPEPSGTGSP